MKVKFLVEAELSNGKIFHQNKLYNAYELDDEYIAIKISGRNQGYVKAPKSEIGKIYEVVK